MSHTRRVVVLGDVRGHRKPFLGQLRALGVTIAPPRIPDDLTIIQIGDLIGIHANPSEHILRMVDALRRACPDQWLQLYGANEARFVPGGANFRYKIQKNRDIDHIHQRLISEWWQTPTTGVAAVIASDAMAPTLVTHAGITSHIQSRLNTTDPYVIASHLNRAARNQEPYVFVAGDLLNNHDQNPGPLFATPQELWDSWASTPLPFDQMVGYIPPYHFERGTWFHNPEEIDQTNATVHLEQRTTWWQSPHSPHGIAHIAASLHSKSEVHHLRPHFLDEAVVEIP